MKNQYQNNILVQNRAVAAAACLPDGRFICNRATLRHNFVLSLRCRSQSLYAPASTKFIAVRLFDTSKGILTVLCRSCSTAAYNYGSSNARSRARGVVNMPFDAPVLRGAHCFFCALPCVACAVSLFITPLRRRVHKNSFSENLHMIHSILQFCHYLHQSLIQLNT